MAPPDVRGRLTLDCLRLLGWEVRVLGCCFRCMIKM
ncbi:hypothetical protein Pmar_PMAR006717, partial [Perkinsus marinus ATCC 50983]